jgi:hypothetical protein
MRVQSFTGQNRLQCFRAGIHGFRQVRIVFNAAINISAGILPAPAPKTDKEVSM